MMWSALLEGDDRCLKLLSEKFSSRIKIKDGQYYFNHPKFTSLDKELGVLKAISFAEKKLKSLMGILKINKNSCKVNISNVVDEQGRTHGTANFLFRGTFVDMKEEPIPKNRYDDWLKCSEKDSKVEEALRCYAEISNENICYKLYYIYEIIRNDLNKDDKKLLKVLQISKNKQKKFKKTLNVLCGEKSRHPPENTSQHESMPISEADTIIRKGLENWINLKCPK